MTVVDRRVYNRERRRRRTLAAGNFTALPDRRRVPVRKPGGRPVSSSAPQCRHGCRRDVIKTNNGTRARGQVTPSVRVGFAPRSLCVDGGLAACPRRRRSADDQSSPDDDDDDGDNDKYIAVYHDKRHGTDTDRRDETNSNG